MRAMSRFEPGLFSISRNPIVRTLTRTFRRAADGRGHDRDRFDSLRFFFELYFDERRAGRNEYSEVSALR